MRFAAGALVLALLMVYPDGSERRVWGQQQAAASQSGGPETVFVDPADGGDSGGSPLPEALRKRLIERLTDSRKFRIVGDTGAAEVVLQVRTVVWATGTVTLNPRSQGGSFTNYQGYATAYLYGGGLNGSGDTGRGHLLWTYLATPRGFRFHGIVDDLAAQIAAEMERTLAGGFRVGGGNGLEVAGATFPAPLYLKWFESFEHRPGGVPMTYDAVGSVKGLEELRAGGIDMAASDIPAGNGAGSDLVRVPSVAGAIVPIYNFRPGGKANGGTEGASVGSLNLTGELLAGIYSGKIKMWDDPGIAAANRGIGARERLPHAGIAVVHRSDGSGTTFVWTSFLAQADAAWKDRAAATVDWPTGTGAAGNEGVAEAVARTPNSIGYVELAYAIQHHLRYAAVRNPAGRYVKASLDTVNAAAASAGSAANAPILNSPGKDAYPIATFTWLVVPRNFGEAGKYASVKAFLRWMLTSGQRQCAELGYAPLPKELAGEELRVVEGWK
jgi:phosphate transport system substrate-binding protein